MSTYTQITYQVVFSAKNRSPVFQNREHRLCMYAYIAGIIRKKQCRVYAINGVEDHLHLLFDLHPSLSLASMIKDIKVATNLWIKENQFFSGFTNWKRGYSAFTYSANAIPNLTRYVENQEAHHKNKSSLEELKRLLNEHNIDFDDRYLE
ncbi:MAG: IS200/IS605 family transposase [Saprospiraceae bacterium]